MNDLVGLNKPDSSSTYAELYFYAPISGYAYLGEQRLVDIAKQFDAEIRFKPIDIALVFSRSETTAPFKQSQTRINYRLHDLQRIADKLGLAINPKPRFWPVPVELAATTIYSAISLGVNPHQISFAILSAVYAQQKDVSDLNTVEHILNDLGLDSSAILDARIHCDIQYQYEVATEEAISLGVFGSPTYVLDKEIFFGQDRLEMLAEALENKS